MGLDHDFVLKQVDDSRPHDDFHFDGLYGDHILGSLLACQIHLSCDYQSLSASYRSLPFLRVRQFQSLEWSTSYDSVGCSEATPSRTALGREERCSWNNDVEWGGGGEAREWERVRGVEGE